MAEFPSTLDYIHHHLIIIHEVNGEHFCSFPGSLVVNASPIDGQLSIRVPSRGQASYAGQPACDVQTEEHKVNPWVFNMAGNITSLEWEIISMIYEYL